MSRERSACSRQDRRDSAGARLTASAAASRSPGATRAAGLAVDDHLGERAAPERDDGSAAGLCLGGDHPERLLPLRRAEHDGRAGHRLPQRRLRHGRVNGDPVLGAARVDLLPRVVGVVGIAVDGDLDAGEPRDGDRLGGALLGAEPAGEQRARSRGEREGDLPRRDERRQDRADGTMRRHASAWLCETQATTGGDLCRTAWRSAPATAASGGRCTVCTMGTSSVVAQIDRGCVEGVVVDDVVAAVAHQVVDPVEGTLGDGRARSGPIRNPVERGRPARGGRRPCRRRRRPAPPTRRRRRVRRRGPCRRARGQARPRRPASRRAAAPGSG